MSTPGNRPRIAVAISAFKSDQDVIRILDKLVEMEGLFEYVFVVDSLGTGAISNHISERRLSERYIYRNSEKNLGSAGNLYARLQMGLEFQVDWVWALNHDADVCPGSLESLLRVAATCPHAGALYPLRWRSGKGFYDLTGESDRFLRARGVSKPPSSDLVEVTWSSSNGALYSMAPISVGIHPDPDLWMGWEDYLYGLRLKDSGFKQYIVSHAVATDNYEYREAEQFGLKLSVADKPIWTEYYSTRNLLLVNLHKRPNVQLAARTFVWVSLAAAKAMVVGGSQRWQRFSTAVHGIGAGMRGKVGKWEKP